jgi:hypothetical protein
LQNVAEESLEKHTALRGIEIQYILPAEIVIILETEILCISFGFYIAGFYCYEYLVFGVDRHIFKKETVFQKLVLLLFR